MKHLLSLLFLVTAFSVTAQDFSDDWTGFFSYNSIKDISQGDNRIYAAADNAILIYDIPNDTTSTISSVNGLAGEPITAIHYSEAYQTLVIGYQSGLVEVVREGQDVLTAVDIIEEISISPLDKVVNHFMERDNNLYVSTDFGIVLYDLENLEFGDTFRIGENGAELKVKQTTVRGDSIYAATVGGGVRFANVNSENLINFEEWQGITSSSFDVVQSIGDQLYTVQTNRILHRIVGNALQTVETLGQRASDMRVSENRLIITTSNEVRLYDENAVFLNGITELEDIDRDYVASTTVEDQLYIAHDSEGLLRTTINTAPIFEALSPDGPLLNAIFNMESIPNELWVTFGDHDIFYNPSPSRRRGVSHLKADDTWTNIPYDSLMEARDIIEVTINPLDTEEVYLSAFLGGVVQLNNESLTTYFTPENAPFFDFLPDNAEGTRINGTVFDSQGNLYIAQGFSGEAVLYRKPNGSDVIERVDAIQEQLPNIGSGLMGKLAVDRNDNIYLGTQVQGLVGFQPSSNTVAQLKDDVGGAGLPDNDIRALNFDLNGRLWIGSTTGLRVLFNPAQIFVEDNVTVDQIIIEENGVAQELLFSQFVSDIETDGSNNKWIGTGASGIFYVSPNGQETFLQFTKDNSPLPSNVITGIEIDEATGRVYIGTPNGLLAYNSTATSPADNLENVRAFPNPVRPNYFGNVVIDGLTENANVKITDITGNLVYEETTVGGSIEWDTTAFGRHRVASGVYLILITGEDAIETQVHKLMIVR